MKCLSATHTERKEGEAREQEASLFRVKTQQLSCQSLTATSPQDTSTLNKGKALSLQKHKLIYELIGQRMCWECCATSWMTSICVSPAQHIHISTTHSHLLLERSISQCRCKNETEASGVAHSGSVPLCTGSEFNIKPIWWSRLWLRAFMHRVRVSTLNPSNEADWGLQLCLSWVMTRGLVNAKEINNDFLQRKPLMPSMASVTQHAKVTASIWLYTREHALRIHYFINMKN